MTGEEMQAALRDPYELTAEALRAGENAYLEALVEAGLYDEELAQLRINDNEALDRGEPTVMSGRP